MRGSNAGLADGEMVKEKMSCHSFLLESFDSLFSSLIVAPLVASYWRGTWNLLAVYLMPHNMIQSSVASLIIGIIGHLVFTIWQGSLRNHFDPNRHRLTFYCGSRLYTSIYGIVCVNCWRGGWQLIDHYTARDMKTIFSITIIAIIVLSAIKALRNVTAAPFVVVTDHSQGYFDVPTMYKKSVRRDFLMPSVRLTLTLHHETLYALIAGHKSSTLLPFMTLV